MAWIRQLDSGKWAATVYTGLGPTDRLSESHISKPWIVAWANRMETKRGEGTLLDPRLGKVTLGELWDLYAADRRLERASHKRDTSHWNVWVAPHWAKLSVGPARKPHVTAWVTDIEGKGAKGWTQSAALNVLRSMFEIARDLGCIDSNPCSGVKTAPPAPHEDRVLDEWEDDILLENLEVRFPNVNEAGLFVECLLYTGCRWEELAAVRRSVVRTKDQGFWVHRVREKSGDDREHGKSASAIRFVAVDDDLWPRFEKLYDEADPDTCDGDLFRAPGNGKRVGSEKLIYDNWLKRTWNKGLRRESLWSPTQIEAWKAERVAAGERPWKQNYFDEVTILDDPQPTPHDMRHTFGTRCAEAGMPRHEIAATMGHSPKGNAVDRYLHARNQRLARAREAMAGVRRKRSPGRPGSACCDQCGQLLPVS